MLVVVACYFFKDCAIHSAYFWVQVPELVCRQRGNARGNSALSFNSGFTFLEVDGKPDAYLPGFKTVKVSVLDALQRLTGKF